MENARRAFRTIYAFNVQMTMYGNFGALNGIGPDGRADRSAMQATEMWTG